MGTLRLLESLRDYATRTKHAVRYYQAGSSEMYGATAPPQREDTPFHPRSPYAVAKVAAHWYAVNYREAYGLFVCNGILFNHESPRRGETFVTRKITRALGRIRAGLQDKLYLGNLEAKRDWGFAGDYVEAMWLMLQQDAPMRPRSPYGVAKLAALGLVRTMRERHGLHVSAGILFNHESPRRPVHFLPRKVTQGAAAIALGLEDELVLGDLRAVRDWCHAADVARAAWLMLRQDEPDDYVIASGVGRTVGDLVNAAFSAAGVSPEGRIRVDPAFVRPPEATPPVGDPSRARELLGWEPEIGFDAMISEMVSADLLDLRAPSA